MRELQSARLCRRADLVLYVVECVCSDRERPFCLFEEWCEPPGPEAPVTPLYVEVAHQLNRPY